MNGKTHCFNSPFHGVSLVFQILAYVEDKIRFKGKLGDLTKSIVNILSVLLKA